MENFIIVMKSDISYNILKKLGFKITNTINGYLYIIDIDKKTFKGTNDIYDLENLILIRKLEEVISERITFKRNETIKKING